MSPSHPLPGRGRRIAGRIVCGLVGLVYVVVVCDKVFAGLPREGVRYNLVPFASIGSVLTGVLAPSGKAFMIGGNLLLLVPLVLMVALFVRGARPWLLTGVALGATLTIESIQLLVNTGRSADVDDLLLNTGGAAVVAFVMARVTPRVFGYLRRPDELALPLAATIAALETGRRAPSTSVEAALRIRPSDALADHREQVRAAIRNHRGHDPHVIGSVARGEDTPDSDLDLMVTFDAGTDLVDLMDLIDELTEILGVPVDIISGRATGQVVEQARTHARPL